MPAVWQKHHQLLHSCWWYWIGGLDFDGENAAVSSVGLSLTLRMLINYRVVKGGVQGEGVP